MRLDIVILSVCVVVVHDLGLTFRAAFPFPPRFVVIGHWRRHPTGVRAYSPSPPFFHSNLHATNFSPSNLLLLTLNVPPPSYFLPIFPIRLPLRLCAFAFVTGFI